MRNSFFILLLITFTMISLSFTFNDNIYAKTLPSKSSRLYNNSFKLNKQKTKPCVSHVNGNGMGHRVRFCKKALTILYNKIKMRFLNFMQAVASVAALKLSNIINVHL